MGRIIAIDGPSGSGKSTAARGVARRLGYHYLDTGAMYRAAAVACLRAGLAADDRAAIVQTCRDLDLDLGADPDDPFVRLAGDDITAAIRQPAVSAWVSAVAVIPEARAELVRRQQAIIARGDFVLEGRDTTTVVAPQAQLRLLLAADPAERLRRRGLELGRAGQTLNQDQLRDQVIRRDRDDSTLVDFQQAAPGVRWLDSTNLTAQAVQDQIIAWAGQADLTAGRAWRPAPDRLFDPSVPDG
ncbi:MAG: (d)CMP kinase [Propionibacteriaceae bacterium]|jgi:cytidylate kinase|nr:(d)CMP kinase [Propionibacteriaceae bacterium]